jgi:putative Mg2+ transporter-C (MgtC) family protein
MDEIFRFSVGTEVEMAIRLLLAAIFGAAVGYEREQAEKPAGMRTLALISLGAAAFTLVSIHGFGVGADPSRVAAQVVTGIGFLGAGAILRLGLTVRGLTTAASIWAIAAVGVAVGAGMYIISAVGTILTLIILHLLPKGR